MALLPPNFTLLQVLPALRAGGVEQTTVDVAAAVVSAGGRAIVASSGGRMEGPLTDVGGVSIRLPLDSKNPFVMAMNASRLARVVRRERVSLIHVRSRAPAFSALLAARRTRVPIVTTYHGVYNAQSNLKRWYNSIMTKGDLTIANSEFTRDHVIAEHGVASDKVISIARGVDLERFDPAAVDDARLEALRTAWKIEPEETRLILLLAGRLSRWKGQVLMIQALARLKAETGRDDFLLILAGDDQGRRTYSDELKSLITNHSLQGAVRVVGHVRDMPAAYMIADVAVTPSLEPEAFGRTAVEPQAMGRPVMAADHGAVQETVVDGTTGWRVKPGDVGAWVTALKTLSSTDADRRIQMGQAGRAHVAALYSVQTMRTRTLDVYQEVLRDRGA